MKRNVITLSVLVTLALIFGFTGCPDPEREFLYTLAYHANGGTGTVPASQTVKEGTVVTVAEPDGLNYPGKIFSGWYTYHGGYGKSYAPGDRIIMDYDYILYARWLVGQYTVTYHINDGTGTVPEPQSVASDDSLTLANGDGFSRDGYFFGGWNTNSSGTGTTYGAGSSFIPTGNNANISLFAMWIAPRIREGDAYKDVTSNGTVRIHLMTDARYVLKGTEEYRLYRSDTQSGTYSIVATVSPDQTVLEDATVDWMTAGGFHYYKVAAVSGGTEMMSTNGVRINKVNPKVYALYSQYLSGEWGVRLAYGDGYMEWTGRAQPSTIYELVTSSRSPPPPGNYTLYTGMSLLSSSLSLSWFNNGSLTIRASHEYKIKILDGGVERSFIKSNWTFF
jgi:hypothetical protein